MKPTVDQAMELYRVCQQLTQMYKEIWLVRIDERTTDLVVFAGDEIEVHINSRGGVDIV